MTAISRSEFPIPSRISCRNVSPRLSILSRSHQTSKPFFCRSWRNCLTNGSSSSRAYDINMLSMTSSIDSNNTSLFGYSENSACRVNENRLGSPHLRSVHDFRILSALTLRISRRKKQSEERAALFSVGWMRSLGVRILSPAALSEIGPLHNRLHNKVC
jgi:hypothetical protein